MGGREDGAVAAQTVIDTARYEFADAEISDPREFLESLCRRAHKAIRSLGRLRHSSPASTCSLLYLRDAEAYWAHVGDSRIYHFRGPELLSRTADHSVAELLAVRARDGTSGGRGVARTDHRLYMCLGGSNDLNPELGACALTSDDWFALCSDGLWSQVDAREVSHTVTQAQSAATAARQLAQLAIGRGGPQADNVSLALVRPVRRSLAWAAWISRLFSRPRRG
jgi:serine/threonine protein phosphatase PrpC